MIEWNGRRLDDLVRHLHLRRGLSPGSAGFSSLSDPQPSIPPHEDHWVMHRTQTAPHTGSLLACLMQVEESAWQQAGVDQVSVVRYLGSLGCCGSCRSRSNFISL